MNLEINIDFDAEEIHMLIDNAIRIAAVKTDTGEVLFKGFSGIESLELVDKLQEVIELLFTIEEEA